MKCICGFDTSDDRHPSYCEGEPLAKLEQEEGPALHPYRPGCECLGCVVLHDIEIPF